LRFWDASAIVPLIANEPNTTILKDLLRTDESIAVWWGTRVECMSALTRKSRDGEIAWHEVDQGKRVLDILAKSWSHIPPSDSLRDMAEAFIRVHPLKAQDAYQLAAAMRWAKGIPRGKEFVCLNGTLRTAAENEGFTILPEQSNS
jgi:uncharacterized protein with PIN domain